MALRGIVNLFPSCAGLLGAAGVAVSAAAAHLAGGSGPATTAGLFLLIHAAAVLALGRRTDDAFLGRDACAGLLLIVGTVLFGGELAASGLWSLRPLPLAAPVGGLMMIAGWLALPFGTLATRRRAT